MANKAVVTGGAGFIGSTLVDRLLAEDWSVDVVDDLSTGSLANLADARSLGARRFSFHRFDVRSPLIRDVLVRGKPDLVFHLAAQIDVRVSVANPMLDAETNILGSLNVLEGCLDAGVSKVIFASSGGTIYGLPEEIPTRESAPQVPESPYGVAKKAVGDYLHYYREARGLESTTLALANVYGPRQDPHGEAGVVAIFAGRLLRGETPIIFGDGSQTRDFVFVDDVVDAFVRASERGGGLLFNIGTGTETSVVRLYEAMARIVKHSGTPRHEAARIGELARSALNPALAEMYLGWKPWTPLDEGLTRTIAHFGDLLAGASGTPSRRGRG
jgi:UDP-glucose 4-epimerase